VLPVPDVEPLIAPRSVKLTPSVVYAALRTVRSSLLPKSFSGPLLEPFVPSPVCERAE
jgi:hypothetical protein